MDASFATRTHGPFGRPYSAPSFAYSPTSDIVGLYGRSDGSVIMQLGFYELRGGWVGGGQSTALSTTDVKGAHGN
jgi:hypothetical protein